MFKTKYNDTVPNAAKVILHWRKYVKNRISSEHLRHPGGQNAANFLTS